MTNATLLHELNRIHTMTDKALYTRYNKMTSRDKIQAFREALNKTGRCPDLRKRIAKDLLGTHMFKDGPYNTPDGHFDFIRVTQNAQTKGNFGSPIEKDIKQAIFQWVANKPNDKNDGQCFLYSYSYNEITQRTGGETMVFRCLPTGDCVHNRKEVGVSHGYVSTEVMMKEIAIILSNEESS